MIASVIVCTHNPNPQYLTRTLSALKTQSCDRNKWELVIVDNASMSPVEKMADISWHPMGRFVRESTLGFTSARIKGIRESKGELVIFVDDDNCLKENYLELLIKTMESTPILGVLGAGKIIPEFEVEPSTEVLPFLRSLAIRNEDRQYFSNEIKYHKAIPFGAGICIRRTLALNYVHTCKNCSIASTLGRIGNILSSGEDIDLALHACRDGYLAGVLPELELIHLIPAKRLEHDYLIGIAAGHAASNYILSQLWQLNDYPQNQIIKWGRYWKNRLKLKGLARKILVAEHKAEKEAHNRWNKFNAFKRI